MREIAGLAEVSERTVYAVFPTKLDLFNEVIGVAMAGDDRPIPIADRPEFREALDEQDGARALRLSIEGASTLLERAGWLIMAGYESVGADRGLREAARAGEGARARDLTLVIQSLADHGALRSGLSVEQATDVLLALASPQVHQMLRRDRGRTPEEYRTVILDSLERVLLAAPSGGASPPPN
jgi:AcrR family transcriptional regulator